MFNLNKLLFNSDKFLKFAQIVAPTSEADKAKAKETSFGLMQIAQSLNPDIQDYDTLVKQIELIARMYANAVIKGTGYSIVYERISNFINNYFEPLEKEIDLGTIDEFVINNLEASLTQMSSKLIQVGGGIKSLQSNFSRNPELFRELNKAVDIVPEDYDPERYMEKKEDHGTGLGDTYDPYANTNEGEGPSAKVGKETEDKRLKIIYPARIQKAKDYLADETNPAQRDQLKEYIDNLNKLIFNINEARKIGDSLSAGHEEGYLESEAGQVEIQKFNDACDARDSAFAEYINSQYWFRRYVMRQEQDFYAKPTADKAEQIYDYAQNALRKIRFLSTLTDTKDVVKAYKLLIKTYDMGSRDPVLLKNLMTEAIMAEDSMTKARPAFNLASNPDTKSEMVGIATAAYQRATEFLSEKTKFTTLFLQQAKKELESGSDPEFNEVREHLKKIAATEAERVVLTMKKKTTPSQELPELTMEEQRLVKLTEKLREHTRYFAKKLARSKKANQLINELYSLILEIRPPLSKIISLSNSGAFGYIAGTKLKKHHNIPKEKFKEIIDQNKALVEDAFASLMDGFSKLNKPQFADIKQLDSTKKQYEYLLFQLDKEIKARQAAQTELQSSNDQQEEDMIEPEGVEMIDE